jgi:hypothetical protein
MACQAPCDGASRIHEPVSDPNAQRWEKQQALKMHAKILKSKD